MADWKKDPASLLDKRIAVLWAKGRKYYGTVKDYDGTTNKHYVVYDDGECRHYDMKTKAFWLKDGMEFRPNIWNREMQSWLRAVSKQQSLKGACFVLSGKLWNSESAIQDFIVLHGGEVKTSVTSPSVTHVIARDGRPTNKLEQTAYEKDIPIVKEDYLYESILSGGLLKTSTGTIPEHLLCRVKMMLLNQERQARQGTGAPKNKANAEESPQKRKTSESPEVVDVDGEDEDNSKKDTEVEVVKVHCSKLNDDQLLTANKMFLSKDIVLGKTKIQKEFKGHELRIGTIASKTDDLYTIKYEHGDEKQTSYIYTIKYEDGYEEEMTYDDLVPLFYPGESGAQV
mmetsp:Transcript_33407/g.42900  ORF Transcript_33407/g.42900 Transcript_33407/m.42900 type:complete len:342 (+) Transcript_33407:140-1165(+)|eukprot:CAMPEP_0117767192 /NCGR_PEP_ID=MMETSP0947-20121206/21450_1 /TAXON_ID=44440 /ORGANISM="Chattonella subsalsa, Strain CCMP2191" /LENGTH=341 /DNA_ID=CAMNT_0005590769 /DNA_START=38 /DNA_END=1063 /DNA_ORIENTATION=-